MHGDMQMHAPCTYRDTCVDESSNISNTLNLVNSMITDLTDIKFSDCTLNSLIVTALLESINQKFTIKFLTILELYLYMYVDFV